MIRITVLKQNQEEVVLKVEGWLVGQDTKILEEEGTRWLTNTQRLILDTCDIRRIDQTGLALLKDWQSKGLAVNNASNTIKMLLV